jgi:hypothetical protein
MSQHRTIARPFFARDRITDFEIFERHSTRTFSILSTINASKQPCEAQDLYSRFALDSASEFLFGYNLDTLSAKLPIPHKTAMGPKGSATEDVWGSFTGAFETAQQIVTTRARIGKLWPLFELFGDKLEPHVKVIQNWLDPLVKRALDDKLRTGQAGVISSIGEKTFLEHLTDSTEGEQDVSFQDTLLTSPLDLILIRDQLLSMLLAARDTVGLLQDACLAGPDKTSSDSLRIDVHNIYHGHSTPRRAKTSQGSIGTLWASRTCNV